MEHPTLRATPCSSHPVCYLPCGAQGAPQQPSHSPATSQGARHSKPQGSARGRGNMRLNQLGKAPSGGSPAHRQFPGSKRGLALHPRHVAWLAHHSSLGAWQGMPSVQRLQGLSWIKAEAFSSRPHSMADPSVTLKPPSTAVNMYSKNHVSLLHRCFTVLQCLGQW